MRVIETIFPDVKIFEPDIFEDERGFFMETFNKDDVSNALGKSIEFIQDNHSHSKRGVLRGLHYQLPPKDQGKLVRVVCGEVLDVVVDVRRLSQTFGHWLSVVLSSDNRRQLWIPPGFAHGFYVRSETADYLYKTTQGYSPDHERSIAWDDESLAIEWGISTKPLLSVKDSKALPFSMAEYC